MKRSRIIVADPPWKFGDKLPGPGRGAAKHYKPMTVAEICMFKLPLLLPDSVLFLWRVSAMQEEALAVMRAWGFTLKSEIVWQKLTKNGKKHFGMGRITRASHETCLIGVRGKPKRQSGSVRSTFEAPVIYYPNGKIVHSAKPDEFYPIVEELYNGPYIELFARRHREGWTCLGDEVDESVEGRKPDVRGRNHVGRTGGRGHASSQP